MYKVYWTDDFGTVFGEVYADMTQALKVTQALRNENCYKFISMVSENPDNVTKMGVADPSPDYNWKKRRT